MTLVDTNVLIDILSYSPVWFEWSAASLESRGHFGPMFINDIIFAELAVRMMSVAELEHALGELNIKLARTPTQALFSAGKAFGRYRSAGGTRTGVLPDFFIGAHAEVTQWSILTRDIGRYQTYFPDVDLIAPNL
jgi:predicted nucleic acid-binding protein